MSGVLYISYDGMLEPLGQSQVLAYLEPLARDRPIHLLSFEKPEYWARTVQREAISLRMRKAGIHWHPRRYHKKPSAIATAYDILVGTLSALWLVVRYRLTIIHARSDVPALMAWLAKRFTSAKFLFDMRGFWADERVDGNLWPRDSRLYRIAKWFERKFLLSADHVVSLTHAAVREMERYPWLKGRMPPMTVISTCADLSRFRAVNTVKDRFILGYVGSAGTWYLFDVAAACFRQLLALRPDARCLIINRNEHDYIRERLSAAHIPSDRFEIKAVGQDEVPVEMAKMQAGIFFIKPVFSKQASAPTKLGEFLGCGIPCLSNRGVGDMAEILEGERVGIALRDFDETSLRHGLEELIALTLETDIQARCVAAAQRHFSLDQGVARYAEIYSNFDGIQK